MELEQEKAEEYLNVRKKFRNMSKINLNQPFEKTEVLFSDLHGDIFKLDLKQGVIELKMFTFNNRAQDCFVLCRLDIDDKVHKNPDGHKINEPHIHFYKEGFGDKFAYPASQFNFTDCSDVLKCLKRFFEICNIDGSKMTSLQEVL